MHEKPMILLITGMPATGKTTLGAKLSEKYHLMFISKDALKERMFNELGWIDKDWSLKISAVSHRIMDYVVDEQLKTGHSIIVESNFKFEIDSERFARIQERYDCVIIQILCWAEGDTLFARFKDRIETTSRHEGHVEISLGQIRADFIENNGRDKPLHVDGETIELDTTDLTSINYDEVYAHIEKKMSEGQS